MTKQHHKPCKSCPFTSRVPGSAATENWESTGYSPPEVYVAQYFMPYLITCHEFVDYDDPEWKAKAADPGSGIPQCVGFAMCRDGGGFAGLLPDMLLHEDRDEKTGAFGDIWDFWAHHKGMLRSRALTQLTPKRIVTLCILELQRGSAKVTTAAGEEISISEGAERLVKHVRRLVQKRWTAACLKTPKEGVTDV